jgi:ABC-type antimicrobial peptide transport system permease subunit
MHQIDPDIPFAQVQIIDEVVEEQTGGQRFTTILLVLFAALGVALTIVGIYGVTYLVARRTRELALRMAVGASPVSILWLIVRQGLSMALVGAVVGLPGAFAARQLISGLLFGISPVDPATFIGGAAGLLLVAAAASAIPATRAMRFQLVGAIVHE